MSRVYLCFCFGVLALAACNKEPLYTPVSGNTTQLYDFQLERTTSNPQLGRFYNGMILGDTAVHLTVDYGTDISSIEPTVLANADSILPKGKQDFRSPVSYTIWANGKSATYTVRIAVSAIQHPAIQTMAAGSSHVFALKNDGTLWASGDNSYGQLGMGDLSSRITMTQVPVYDVAKVYTGDISTVVLLKDGTAWATGNTYGQLGTGTANSTAGFVRQPFFDDAVQIAVTYGEIIVLKPDGSLWGAGRNNYQLLAQGDRDPRYSFVKLPVSDVRQISSFSWDILVQKTNGEVWGWGYNFLGELGFGDSTARSVPTKISTPPGVTKLICGAANSFLIDNAGQVWGVGVNVSGQLGLGDKAKHLSYTELPFFDGKSVADIQPGPGYTLFLDGTGGVWGVGVNYNGQLAQGNVTSLPYLSPVPVNGMTATALSAHGIVAFAFTTDGALWGWGGNPSDVLTIAPGTTYSSSPVQILK